MKAYVKVVNLYVMEYIIIILILGCIVISYLIL